MSDAAAAPGPAAATHLFRHRPAQAARLARFGATGSVDVHCHCLPGLDDGPATMADALAVCRALVDDGVTAVIATPHQRGPFEHVSAAAVREAVVALQAELAGRGVPLAVRAGAEIRIDETLADGLAAGDLLALPDGGPHVLIELPHSTLLDLRGLIDTLTAAGRTPVLAHPERHATLARSPQLLVPWLERGLRLQVTGASLTGDFGPIAQAAAWQMVESGRVSVIASDAHDTDARAPALSRAIDALAGRFGHAVARRLCVVHPQLIFEGRPLPRPVLRRTAGGRR